MKSSRLFIEAFAAWSLSFCLVMISAYASGVDPFRASSYARADSGHYLAIAVSGYEFFSCAKFGDNPDFWCGNAGWLPGYPLLIRLFTAFGLDAPAAGFLISEIFLMGTFLLLKLLLEEILQGRENSPCFLLGAVFPGGIYFHAIFPISMLMFFSLATILLVGRRHYLLSSIAAACGAFTYSTGFLLTGVVLMGVLFTSDAPASRRIGQALLYGAIAFSGFVAVWLVHLTAVGHWDAFFLTQAKYGHGIHNPFATYTRIWKDWMKSRGGQEHLVPATQTFIVGIAVMTLLCISIARIWNGCRPQLMAATHVGLFWIFPLIMGAATLTRAEANLLPLVLLAAAATARVQAVLLIVFAFLCFEVNVAFFKAVLV